jgi:hypothetical protein
MYLIKEILVSAEVFNRKFICNLDKCKGACCWEGDFGAPVEDDEQDQILQSLDAVKPYLSEANIQKINENGAFHYDGEYGGHVTSLMDDGSCAFLFKDKLGHAVCSFERAFQEGKSTFRKPISCHLYPLRVKKNALSGFEAINYDEWDICSPACTLGEEMSMPVFRFTKDALIRAYGEEFYNELEDIYEQMIVDK